MRVALLSPLPPARSGIAHYASMLIPALGQQVDLRAFGSADGYEVDDYDLAIYQLGNNPHHEWIYREADRRPGLIVLHDLVLHHLIVEMTLARGDIDGYVASLQASHGAAGAAWARGRAAGLHSEMGNFLLPASVDLARRSLGVIVHNQYAADRLRSFGVSTPIEIVPHPYAPETRGADRAAMRRRLQIAEGSRVIGVFGFLTSAKRAEVTLEAFQRARREDPSLVLLIVGEPAPNIDAQTFAGDGVVITGYVSDEDFPAHYAAADRLVNLRYPSAGESSGTLIRAFDAGKPVAVSDYAQFAELPDACVRRIPLGAGEVDALVAFMLADDAPSTAQRAWLETNASLDLTVAGYLRAIAGARSSASASHGGGGAAASLPLFSRLELASVITDEQLVTLTVRNGGETTLRSRMYGEPEVRLVVHVVRDGRVVQDLWLELPSDLAPGDETQLQFSSVDPAGELKISQAVQGVPSVEPLHVL